MAKYHLHKGTQGFVVDKLEMEYVFCEYFGFPM
jgi:hypothetical protein